MYWKNLLTEDQHWRGLELTVARRRTPPAWRIEFASPRYLRIRCQETPLLWVRFDQTPWEGFSWLSAPGAEVGALEPLRAREVERITEPPGSEEWYAAWARHFARALALSPCSPLYEGHWRLMRGSGKLQASQVPRGAVVHGLERYPDQPLAGDTAVDAGWSTRPTELHFGLKPPSELSASRLKVWRKRARDGTLPPVLLLYITSLDGCVVLDGHHRWMAALEEQRPIALLTLWHADVRTLEPDVASREVIQRLHEERLSGGTGRRPLRVEDLNALALKAWGPRTDVLPVTRVWPLPGRAAHWMSEVRARLDTLGPAVEPSVREALLDTST